MDRDFRNVHLMPMLLGGGSTGMAPTSGTRPCLVTLEVLMNLNRSTNPAPRQRPW